MKTRCAKIECRSRNCIWRGKKEINGNTGIICPDYKETQRKRSPEHEAVVKTLREIRKQRLAAIIHGETYAMKEEYVMGLRDAMIYLAKNWRNRRRDEA